MDEHFIGELFGLDGRVALVTGARFGIGRAIAVALARAGADVAVTSRRADGLQDVIAEIGGAGRRALALDLELTDARRPAAVVQEVVDHLGRIDILVNNGAIAHHGPSIDYPVSSWDETVATNLRGTFLMTQAAARAMGDTGGGRIVNVSSTFARVGVAERAAYSATKAALEQLVRALAVEWGTEPGITVNAVAPTTVITETRQHILGDEDALRQRIEQIPLGRLAVGEDIVGAVLLLAGPGGRFITGQTIVVDGGYTIARI